VELPPHRLHGEVHVGAGVAVRDRIDVEGVDLVDVDSEPVGRVGEGGR
jgi:hypothetical protein